MKTIPAVFLASLASMIALPQAFAADQWAANTVKTVCSKCHGPEGVGNSPMFPRLAGQQEAYLTHQLVLFRARSRADAHARAYMWGISSPLNDQQIAQLAHYLSTRKRAKPTPPENPQLAAAGQEIFEKGVPARSVPACRDCHGAEGTGMLEIPRLAGQYRDYLFRAVQEFRGLLRRSEIMHDQTKNVTDEEALAVAEYMSSK